jgi:hypothetical protein
MSSTGVRRALFNKREGGGDRHSSWHNLIQIGDDDSWQRQKQKQAETSLVKKQESYISQLEKETMFCREQLVNVLGQMKEVLAEKDSQSR